MPLLFEPPELDLEDTTVLDDIAGMRENLASWLRTPRRWVGGLPEVRSWVTDG